MLRDVINDDDKKIHGKISSYINKLLCFCFFLFQHAIMNLGLRIEDKHHTIACTFIRLANGGRFTVNKQIQGFEVTTIISRATDLQKFQIKKRTKKSYVLMSCILKIDGDTNAT